MIEHMISPFIVQFTEGFGIRWYSLVYIAGFIAAYYFLRHLAREKTVKGLDEKNLDSLLLYIILGVVIGARFFHSFIFEPAHYLSDPLDFFKVWHGGLSFHGGLVGIALAIWLYCRRYKTRFFELADALAIIAPVFLFLGRIANFINGELYGTLSQLPFCIDYSNNPHINPPEGCRHPSQIYEALKNLFMFLVLFTSFKKDKFRLGSGIYTWLLITMYGLLRFLITFYRDEPVLIWGLQQAQVFSLLMFIIGGIMLFRIFRR